MNKKAFTMIELIFVIVILGILSTVAIPYFAGTKRNAEIVSGKADIASIRAAIVSERQTQLVKGKTTNQYMPNISDIAAASNAGDTLFTGTGTIPAGTADDNRTLLLYGIVAGSTGSGWFKTAVAKQYKYGVTGVDTTFTYDNSNGKFSCVADTGDCNALVK